MATHAWTPSGKDQRDHRLDDHHERQCEGDQRTDALPAADDRDRRGEQCDEQGQDRDPVPVVDGDEARPLVARDLDHHLVAELVVGRSLRRVPAMKPLRIT